VDGVVCHATGAPIGQRGWWWCRPLFYVCPKSGLLKKVRRSDRVRRVPSRPNYLVIDEYRQWHEVGGLWFEVELAPVAVAPPEARDVLLKATVGSLSLLELEESYGSLVYATSKRQLGKREVRIAKSRMAELAGA
jgi:hypothetical protein